MTQTLPAPSITPQVSQFRECQFPSSAPMIDWLSGRYHIQDPDGRIVPPSEIPGLSGSRVQRDSPSGKRTSGYDERRFRLPTGASIRAHNIKDKIWIHGNPTQGVQGQNDYSGRDPWEILDAWRVNILKLWGIPDHTLHLEWITRIDLTHQVDCDSPRQCADTLVALSKGWSSPRKRRTCEEHGVYLGQRSTSWSVKAYRKPLKKRPGHVEGGGLNLSSFLRIEIGIRTAGIRQLGLASTPLREWPIEGVYAGYLDRCRVVAPLAAPAAIPEPPKGISGKLAGYLARWQGGQRLKEALAPSTFYRIRAALIQYGFDIAQQPTGPKDCRGLSWAEISTSNRWYGTSYMISEVVQGRLRRALRQSRWVAECRN